jgi:hypothetical protein
LSSHVVVLPRGQLSTVAISSGLEFESRDGAHSGAVATGRHGLDGAWTATCLSCPALGSCGVPCLKGQSSSHSSTQSPIPVPPWQLHLLWEISSGPDIGRTGNAHRRSPAVQFLKPCLACCIAPASPTRARVMQLSLSCCGLVGGSQARDCNLLQISRASSSGSKSAAIPARQKLVCTD